MNESRKSHFGGIETFPTIKIIYPDQSDASNLLKKIEDITDVTGGNADISDVGDVINEVVNDLNPITILTDDNFANTTETDGWIVTSAECENREKCDKVKQTIVGNKDGIDEVTNGTVQFGTVQTTDRNWLLISRL